MPKKKETASELTACPSCKADLKLLPLKFLTAFVYCPYCGRELRQVKTEIKVPQPMQLPSGSWRIILRKENASITEDTAELCIAKAKAIRAEFLTYEKPVKTEAVTIGELVDKYIEDNKLILSASTVRAYKSYRKFRFQALMNLDAHSDINFQRHINYECSQCSAKTVLNAWRLITASLKAARITIPDIDILNLPKKVKKDRQFLDYEQIQVFLKAIEGEECELAALLALHSLRLSELLAITPDRVDLKKNIIHVRGAVVLGEEGLIRSDKNKTYKSTRDIPIMIPRLAVLLKGLTAETMLEFGRKRPYDHINKVCRINGLPEVGVHGLRHSFASLAYHLRWSEETTMRIGGWSNPTIVHEIYTHLANQDINDDIRAMKNFFNGSYDHNVIKGGIQEAIAHEIAHAK